jgi:tripartite-type tricarboxylate transporter receptor subunit TctC
VNVFTDAEVIYTRADGPHATLDDVIRHARDRRGRWGAANPASLERQAAERLRRAANVQAAIVSHEGGGDLMINVLNGTLEIGVGEIQELRSQLDGNRIRLLATFNPQRLPGFPNLPTVRELGYDVAVQKFRGLAGPKGLPAEVIQAWERAVPRLLADPEYKRVYEAESLVPSFIPHAEYGTFIQQFATESEAFLRETGVIRR